MISAWSPSDEVLINRSAVVESPLQFSGCFHVDSKSMPLIVIEEMVDDFDYAKKTCNNLRFQGSMHPRHSQFLSHVHVIYPSARQLYVARDLHLHPHYGIAPADIVKFHLHCNAILDGKDSLIEYPASHSYTTNSFLKIWNFATPEFSCIEWSMDALNLQEALELVFYSGDIS